MDPEDSELTATAPVEGEPVEDALAAGGEGSPPADAQAPTDSAPDAPAAASAPDAEPPQKPDKRAILDDPETAAWLEERVNARVTKHLQRLQQQQALAQQQAEMNDLRSRARQGDYEAERQIAALKLAELDDLDRTTDPVLTTRVLDGLVKGFLNDPRNGAPKEVKEAVYNAPTVYDSYEAYAQFRLKDYVPKAEASRREAQATEKERLRMAKTSAAPDLAGSASFVETPSGPLAEITAITERTQKRGYLSGADAATLERLGEAV